MIELVAFIVTVLLLVCDGFSVHSFKNSLHGPKTLSERPDRLIARRQHQLFAIKGPIRYSVRDWVDCLTTLPSSRILKRTAAYTFFSGAWTTILVLLFKSRDITFLLPSVLHSILGSALALLLVFRTNSSYDRFWEARKLWGSVLESGREISRLSGLHIPPPHHERIAKLLIVFSIVLKQHLQGERINSEVMPFLKDDGEVTSFQRMLNRPAHVIKLLGETIKNGLYEHNQDKVVAVLHEHSFLESLHAMNHALAGCERILKQPVPLSHSRHTLRFLSLYLFSLPLTIIPLLGYWSVPAILAVTWSFASILEMSHFIEEPFRKELEILPLAQLITVLRQDVSETLNGVVSGPEIEKVDESLLADAKERCIAPDEARMRSDSFFAYY